MKEKGIKQIQETLCINTEKVYDWVMEESSGSTTIPVGPMPTPLPAGALGIETNCKLTDETGTPIPLNSTVPVTESAPRQNQQFEVGGTTVTLQRVTFTKTLYVVLAITGTDPTTGMQFMVNSDPTPFTFVEIAYLCAPPGTSLVVRISDFSCLTVIEQDGEGVITGFTLNITACQSIQSVAPVTIELGAGFCAPREALTETCAGPSIPPQCPAVFPGNSG